MNCVICRNGETEPGRVTVSLTRGETTIIVKAVPADVCTNCGEYYLSSQTAEVVARRADNAARNGAEVEILRFAA